MSWSLNLLIVVPTLGYKTRTFLAKSLQKRSKAIRRAVTTYNGAAAALNPPREKIDMAEISQYNYVEQFTLLRDTRDDIRNKPWAKPLYREVFRLRHRIARAKEEILRCNVETRRLHTSIFDQDTLYNSVLKRLKSEVSLMYGPVRDYVIRRTRVNQALLNRVHQIQDLEGFSGDATLGVRVGSTASRVQPTPTAGLEHNIDNGGDSVPTNEDRDSDEEAESDVENDDEFHRQEGGIDNFLQTVSLQS